MLRRVALGILAALFFSSTFVLNRAMSLAGGHWAWTASLRFGYMLLFLILILWGTRGWGALAQVWQVFRAHWFFWIVAGSIGFGVFYALITFSAAYAAGWVVATTWQITILATPVVLLFFGRKVPVKGLFFSGLIFGCSAGEYCRTYSHQVMGPDFFIRLCSRSCACFAGWRLEFWQPYFLAVLLF